MASDDGWTACADRMPPQDREVRVKNALGEGIGIYCDMGRRGVGWMLSDGSITGDGAASRLPTHWREFDDAKGAPDGEA